MSLIGRKITIKCHGVNKLLWQEERYPLSNEQKGTSRFCTSDICWLVTWQKCFQRNFPFPSLCLWLGLLLSSCCLVAKSCATLCNPMDCSLPGFPVLHYLPESVQTPLHWIASSWLGNWGSIYITGRRFEAQALLSLCFVFPWPEVIPLRVMSFLAINPCQQEILYDRK